MKSFNCSQELVKHTTDSMEKANLKLALDAMKVGIHDNYLSLLANVKLFLGGDNVFHSR